MNTVVLTQVKHMILLLSFFFIILGSIFLTHPYVVEITDNLQTKMETKGPSMEDPKFGIEVVASGVDFPSDMAFLDTDDILLLEKNSGKVLRIVNGQILD